MQCQPLYWHGVPLSKALASTKGASIGRPLVWLLGAAAIGLLWLVSALLPINRASALGRAFMRWLGPRLHVNKKVQRNLAQVFPDRSDQAIRQLARDCWGNFGRVLAEYPHLKTICGSGLERHIEVVFDGQPAAWRDAGRPAIFVSAHLANWELPAAIAVTNDIPLSVVYTPRENPLIDRLIQYQRRALNCRFAPKTGGIRTLLHHLAEGRSVGIVADQRVEMAELVPFFNRNARTATMPARLALKFGYELVPVRVERIEGPRFRLTVCAPIRPRDDITDHQAQVLDMTRRVNEVFETWIRERPHEWHCTKRRWPKGIAAEAHVSEPSSAHALEGTGR